MIFVASWNNSRKPPDLRKASFTTQSQKRYVPQIFPWIESLHTPRILLISVPTQYESLLDLLPSVIPIHSHFRSTQPAPRFLAKTWRLLPDRRFENSKPVRQSKQHQNSSTNHSPSPVEGFCSLRIGIVVWLVLVHWQLPVVHEAI